MSVTVNNKRVLWQQLTWNQNYRNEHDGGKFYILLA